MNVYCPFTFIIMHLSGCYLKFPHCLVLDSLVLDSHHQNLKKKNSNFLINQLISMKIVANCSAFISLSYKVHVKVYNPISSNTHSHTQNEINLCDLRPET